MVDGVVHGFSINTDKLNEIFPKIEQHTLFDGLKKTYEGYIFDKIIRNDKLYQYMVFIPELKMTSRLTSRYNMENYLKYNFKIYIFIDEIRLKQKIRIELIQ